MTIYERVSKRKTSKQHPLEGLSQNFFLQDKNFVNASGKV